MSLNLDGPGVSVGELEDTIFGVIVKNEQHTVVGARVAPLQSGCFVVDTLRDDQDSLIEFPG